jgi:hypothetical protein
VGYFMGDIKNHSRAVSHRNYFACRKWGISEEQEWFSKGYLYFRCNLRAYGALFCNWKWIKWFRLFFLKRIKKIIFFFTGTIDHAPQIFLCGEGIWSIILPHHPSHIHIQGFFSNIAIAGIIDNDIQSKLF